MIRDVEGPQRISVTAQVVSSNDVTSPLSGLRAAVLVVNVLERFVAGGNPFGAGSDNPQEATADAYRPLGSVVLGTTLELVTEAAARLVVPVSEASFIAAAQPTAGASAFDSSPPPEVAALVARASGRGAVCYREQPLCTG